DPFVPRATTINPDTSGTHFLILAGVPMHDSGGGQRSAQLALELLHRSHRVTYVYRYRSSDRIRQKLRFAHENLTHIRFSEFSARRFGLERGPRERIVVISEFPLPEYRAISSYLRSRGALTIYDCVDAWDTSLGYGWYTRRTEDALAQEVDVVIASAKALQDDLRTRTGRDVSLLPNAVNTRIFRRGKKYERPLQMPQAQAIYTYVGALWGEWFNWDWIQALARAQPNAAVVLIGEYRGECRNPPPNVHFLGLLKQTELPAWLAHSDVALIPFKLDQIVRAVSPLKVFEYLSMGCPVVASQMPELEGLPGVVTANSTEDFVRAVVDATGKRPERDEVTKFVLEHSWTARVKELERLAGC
ncbi:MAG: glycosyltransferase, partial [Myxococcales bacterium]